MKVGIVGCGLNSDYHIKFAKEYANLEIIGVVDRVEAKAQECANKHNINRWFVSIDQLIEYQKPDVVHIITPPASHYNVAREVIELGCHVLVEKPLTLDSKAATELFELAHQKNVKLCTMHNHFFDPCMLQARKLIDSGAIGRIINVESYYGLNTQIDAFRKYPKPNRLPWLFGLPGGVFHDFMAHPLYVLLPFTGEPAEIALQEKSFGEFPQNLSDELRILVKGSKALGVLTFSFASKPHYHFVRFYGTKAVIQVNFDTMTATRHLLSRLPKAAQKAIFNLSEGWQLTSSTISNVWNFARKKLKPYQGMKILIHQFYDYVDGKAEAPVSQEDALMVIKTMDKAWTMIKNKRLNFEPRMSGVRVGSNDKPRVLVTGATGFLGSRLVEILVQRGFPVRSLARKLSNIEKLQKMPSDIYFGDVGDMESLQAACLDVDVVVHAAADTSGNEDDSRVSTLLGTQNIINLCKANGIKKLIYISSCSVYGVADYKKGRLVDETASLERYPDKRGHYSSAKYKADQLVMDAIKSDRLPAACLRPGTIFGPGGEVFTPMMGFSLGTRVFGIIGRGDFVLPLVFIDNLVDAIIQAIEKDESIGQVFNVVDADNPTKKEYVELLLKRLYPEGTFFYMPYGLLYAAVWGQEVLTRMLRRSPFLTRYRLTSSQKKIRYDSSKIRNALNWKPPYPMKEAIEAVIEYQKKRD